MRFDDLRAVLLQLEFSERIRGSHHIFVRDDFEEIINIQPTENGKAKPYQVKQTRNLIVKYRLKGFDDEV
ncbi:MAG: type II toxin-antitoxin system HicA family toxin [bacterium]|nr:type II toxin-antitoxin system HicA family toxin [bacterium]